MYVLITYDVDTVSEGGKKRLRHVSKACQDYGQRVQNSVFECVLSESQYITLKERIGSIMDMQLDNIRFYFLSSKSHGRIEILGASSSFDVDDTIIV